MSFKVPELPARYQEKDETSSATQTNEDYMPPDVKVALALAIALRLHREHHAAPEVDSPPSSAASSQLSSDTNTSSQCSSGSTESFHTNTKPLPGFFVRDDVCSGDVKPTPPRGESKPFDIAEELKKYEQRADSEEMKEEPEHETAMSSLLDSINAIQQAREITELPFNSSEDVKPFAPSTPPRSSPSVSKSPVANRRSPRNHKSAVVRDVLLKKQLTLSTPTRVSRAKTQPSFRLGSPLADFDFDGPPTPPHIRGNTFDPFSGDQEPLDSHKSLAHDFALSGDVFSNAKEYSDEVTPVSSERDSIPATPPPLRSGGSSSSGSGRKMSKVFVATRRSPRNHRSTCEHDVEIANQVAPPVPMRRAKTVQPIRKVAVSPIAKKPAKKTTTAVVTTATKTKITRRTFDPKRAASPKFWTDLLKIQVELMHKICTGSFYGSEVIGFSVDSWVLLEKTFSALTVVRSEDIHHLITTFLANSIKIYELLNLRGFDNIFMSLLDFLRGVLRKYLSFPTKMKEDDMRWIHAREAIRMVLCHLTQKEVLLAAHATLTDVQQRFVATWTSTEDPPAETDMDFICYGIDQLAAFTTVVNTRIQQARRLEVHGLLF